MALADSAKAIGKVTELLRQNLEDKTGEMGIEATVGRPEPSSNSSSSAKPRLNLFLYEALFDPTMKNIALDEGQSPPLWLVLKYLITAFDHEGKSDTSLALENLGIGLRALQELSFLSLSSILLPPDISAALGDNPEVLKITFDEAPSELLSKLMQGTDEKYRFSMSFQVRPVMIAAGAPPAYALLVGVDYTENPPAEIGEAGIQIPVIPALGPNITKVDPAKFELNDTLTISGENLDLSDLSVRLGPAELAVTAQRPNLLQCKIDQENSGGGDVSAGSHALSVVQTLPTGRRRSSNLLVGALLPILTGATPDSLGLTDPEAPKPPQVFGDIEMTGSLLGRKSDDIFVALYKDGEVVKVFDAPFTHQEDQKSLILKIPHLDAVPPAGYRIILRVNGHQARNSPEVELIV
jgi:hypothetical protein